MVRHLGSSLTDITYVFDEPSVGLHPHDVGPFAGSKGGEVVYEGDFAGLLTSGTLTGNHMAKHLSIKDKVRQPSGELKIAHARLNNLKDVSVTLPKGVLIAVSGVAGSGKSSLIQGCLPQACPEAIIIDQNLTRGSRRSNTATYTGILDNVRKALAKANAVDGALFSANSKGRARTAMGWASSIPTSLISTPWSSPAKPARASAFCPKCWSTACAANPLAMSIR